MTHRVVLAYGLPSGSPAPSAPRVRTLARPSALSSRIPLLGRAEETQAEPKCDAGDRLGGHADHLPQGAIRSITRSLRIGVP
jgi:hypothetical protein